MSRWGYLGVAAFWGTGYALGGGVAWVGNADYMGVVVAAVFLLVCAALVVLAYRKDQP